MGALLFDLRQVLRGLVRAPGFSLLAIAGLAIGVAASTAMFTVVDTILWRPLPYPAPERQVILLSVDAHGARVPLGSEFFALQAMAKTVESIGVMMPYDATVDARELRAAKVSASLFATLGIVPAQGRAFEPAEDREGSPPVAIVADSYWRNELGADPHA